MAGVKDARGAVGLADVLGEDFVPLGIAAKVAYCRLTEIHRRLPDAHPDEITHLCAIALSTVAPIYMTTGAGAGRVVLSPVEVEELLFRPIKHSARTNLDGFSMRKTDMEKGIHTLRAARSQFWKKQ